MKRMVETSALPIAVFVATIVGVVLVLPEGGYLQRYVGVSLPDLIPVVILTGALFLAGEAVGWARPKPPTGSSDESPARSIAGLALRGWSYAAGLYVLLIATPPIAQALADTYASGLYTSRLELLASLAPWAGGIFAFFVLVRAAGMASPLIAQVFYVPRFMLVGLAGLYVLIGEQGFVTQDMGVVTPPFWTFMAVATLVYLAQAVRRARWAPEAWLDEDEKFGAQQRTWVAINLLLATAAAGVTWAALDAVPQVSEFAPESLEVYASRLYTVRHLAAALVWVMVIAWSLRPLAVTAVAGETSAFIEAVAWASGAGLVWAIGTTLPPSPSGYLLVASMVAVGLLFTSFSALARIATGRNWPVVEEAAAWLASSQWRAFVLGASLVVYGLFVRPLMYYSMWYAPVLEWIAVISLAVLILMKTTRTIRQHVETGQLASPSPIWTRHQQRVTTNPDRHYVRVTRLQREFVNDGELIGIWAYIAMVLIQNRVPLDDMAHVLGPLAGYYLDPPTRHWYTTPSRAERRERDQRLRVIQETLRRIETTFEHSTMKLGTVDSAILRTLGDGALGSSQALPFVVSLIVASHQNGASITVAAVRWLRMLIIGPVPTRWWDLLPWRRKRTATRTAERRERLIDDSIVQALDPQANRRVYVARWSWLFDAFMKPSPRSRLLAEIEQGSLFEVRVDEEEYHAMVTSDHVYGYVFNKQGYLQRVDGQYFENRFEGVEHGHIRRRGSRSAVR